MLSGPDVSEYQGDVDWKKVAKRHELAIVRISDGDYRDPWYTKARLTAIKEAGLLFAPYYFARVASPQNRQRGGAAEARMAISFVRKAGWRGPSKGQLPLIYDFETNNGQPHKKCATHLVEFVRAYRERTKHYPGIYTMPGFWRLVLPYLTKADRRLIARCFLHQAEWEVSGPSDLEPWNEAAIWQFTETGRCPGISGGCDLNRTITAEARLYELAQEDQPSRSAKGKAKPSGNAKQEDKNGKAGGSIPAWVPERHRERWQKPWQQSASRSASFRGLLWRRGFLSPNFARDEARCNDAANTPVPDRLRTNAQRHAFNLERLRHELGDTPLPVLSWYRTPAHNAAVGGASHSRHMQADASDFTTQLVDSLGRARFDAACQRIWSNGGFGRYPAGSRHSDSRGSRARW